MEEKNSCFSGFLHHPSVLVININDEYSTHRRRPNLKPKLFTQKKWLSFFCVSPSRCLNAYEIKMHIRRVQASTFPRKTLETPSTSFLHSSDGFLFLPTNERVSQLSTSFSLIKHFLLTLNEFNLVPWKFRGI